MAEGLCEVKVLYVVGREPYEETCGGGYSPEKGTVTARTEGPGGTRGEIEETGEAEKT